MWAAMGKTGPFRVLGEEGDGVTQGVLVMGG